MAGVAAVCLFAGCGSDERRASVHLQRASEYEAADRLGDAIVELRSALSHAPRDLDLHWRLGSAYLAARDFHRAEFYFNEAYLIDPSRPEAGIRLADLLVNSDPARAIELIDQVFAQTDDDPAAHLVRAELHLISGNPAAALGDAARAIELDPDDPDGYFKRIRIYEAQLAERRRKKLGPHLQLVKRALASYDDLLERVSERRRPEALLGRARLLSEWTLDTAGASEAHRASLDAAASLGDDADRRRAAIAANRFATHHGLDPLNESALEMLVEVQPMNIGAWETLTALRRRRGASADDLFQRLLAERPRDPLSHIIRARYLFRTEGVDAAIDYLETPIEDGIDPPRLISVVAELQIDARRFEEVKETGERLKREYPGHWRANVVTAYLAMVQGDLELSLKLLRNLGKRHPEPEILRRLAAAELFSGELHAALAAVDYSIRKSSDFAEEAKRLKGLIQYELGDCGHAIQTFMELDRFNELPPSHQLLLARCRYRTNAPHAGREIYLELLASDDPPLEAALELAEWDGSRPEQQEQVREVLVEALQRHPGNPKLVTRLASLEIESGNYPAAIELLNPMVRVARTAPSFRMLRAHARAGAGDIPGAILDAKIALRNDNKLSSGALQLLVQLAIATQSVPSTIESLESALASSKMFASDYVLLGQLYMLVGRNEAARQVFTRAVESFPDLHAVKNDLAYLMARDSTDLERAEQLAREASEAFPDDANTLDTLAMVLIQRGQYNEALRHLRTAASLAPEPSAEIQYHIGVALQGLGRAAPAVRAYVRALQINPNFRDARAAAEAIRELRPRTPDEESTPAS